MSEENVEASLLALDAWNRRDVEATIELWDPEGAWHPALERLTEGRSTYRGHAGVRQYFEDLAEFSEKSHGEYGFLSGPGPIARRGREPDQRGD